MNDANLSALDFSGSFAIEGKASRDGCSFSVHPLEQKGHGPGDLLAGKYRIIARLGEGGMGTVWRAHSLWLDVDVAIKVLHREQVDANAAERLLREARATAKLGHPAIVRVFDFGETDAGEPFLVMELLEGISLADWLEGCGSMPAVQAVQMLLPVASALATAHARGIVHRDIKPGNIIAVPERAGTYLPKIVDFGVAKLASAGDRVLTQAGTIVGSPQYMSPEQANGMLEVGEQTDVWALCVVLYELITGRRPFDGQTLSAIISAIFYCDPPPTTQLSAGDQELWEIIERGLKKSPADRWPNMRALGCALASWAVRRGFTTDVAGTSLAHHWLATQAAPTTAAGSTVPASGLHAPVVCTWPREVLRNTVEGAPLDARPASFDPPAGSGPGTVELAYASNDSRSGVTPAPKRTKAILVGAVAGLIAPLVVAVGLRAHNGNASTRAGDRPAATAAATPLPVPAMAPASATASTLVMSSISDIAPDLPKAPRVAAAGKRAGVDAPVKKARDHRSAPAARYKAVPLAMPLPAAPDF
jgi:eukaryotic-like serine/threonine-protein kinase